MKGGGGKYEIPGSRGTSEEKMEKLVVESGEINGNTYM